MPVSFFKHLTDRIIFTIQLVVLTSLSLFLVGCGDDDYLLHPAESVCMKIVDDKLTKARESVPRGWSRLPQMRIVNNQAQVVLSYEINWKFQGGVAFETNAICTFGPATTTENFMLNSLNQSPFQWFKIKSVEVNFTADSKVFSREQIPASLIRLPTRAGEKLLKKIRREIPGFIVGWKSKSSNGYVLSDKPLSDDQLKAEEENIKSLSK